MTQGLSSSCLPARSVMIAAQCALDRLDNEKDDLKGSLIMTQRKLHWRTWGRSDGAVWDGMPDEIKKIVDLYRVQDRKVIDAILGLAAAAIDTDETFTVVMTADDFRLVQRWYKPLTKRVVPCDDTKLIQPN